MYVSVILARFWALFFVITSLAFLADQDLFFRSIRSIKQEGTALLSATLALILGIFHILIHTVWIADWRVIVTLMGWTVFLKGVCWFFFPGFTVIIAKKVFNRHLLPFLLLSELVLGGYLFYIGYFS